MVILKVKKMDVAARLPTRAHYGDLGYDLYALEDVILEPGEVTLIRTGIACQFPDGWGAILKDRSSVATKQNVFIKAGVIDQGYTGEIKVAMFNPISDIKSKIRTDERYSSYIANELGDVKKFKAGDKIAQMILIPVSAASIEEVENLELTERNDNGFGSSGV